MRWNNPPGALGVDTITMKGSDLAMYLSDTAREGAGEDADEPGDVDANDQEDTP